MARNKRVDFKKFKLYDKFHTLQLKLKNGKKLTSLLPIKETKEFWVSVGVWSNYSDNFKRKKKNLPNLEYNIPILKDKEALLFLKERGRNEWLELHPKNTDFIEAVGYLKKLFPKHKIVYYIDLARFFEMLCNANFKKTTKPSDYTKWVNYQIGNDRNKDLHKDPNVIEKYECYRNYKGDENIKSKLYDVFHKSIENHAWDTANVMHILERISDSCVCYPVAFSDATSKWAIGEYGRVMPYGHAGEIIFIVADDTIYFEVQRHY